jgi:hypothetical protein
MVIVELRRTAVVKLDVDDNAHHLLQETIDRFIMTVVAVYR